jgi:predicted MPP superfamily phosphohydrolase
MYSRELVLVAILSPFYLYLGLRLCSHWAHWSLLTLLFVTILSFPFKKLFRFQLHLIYAGMGILTYLLVFTVLRDLVLLSFKKLLPVSDVLILTAVSLLVGFVNARKGPRVRRIKVLVNNLNTDLEGLKIAQISDLHVGATIRKPYVDKVVTKINALKSDLVVMTGDIGDGKVQQFLQDIAPLGNLQSKYGSFFVPGNHEYYWNVNEWMTVMKNLGVMNLLNEGKIIQHQNAQILIAGVPDPVARLEPKLDAPKVDFNILLSHRPGIAQKAADAGFHLQLSGHTHGGQFFPWTIVVRFVHKLSEGLHRVGNMWVYVNPGTGSWGPLLRLGTTPEITLLELHRAHELKIIHD